MSIIILQLCEKAAYDANMFLGNCAVKAWQIGQSYINESMFLVLISYNGNLQKATHSFIAIMGMSTATLKYYCFHRKHMVSFVGCIDVAVHVEDGYITETLKIML